MAWTTFHGEEVWFEWLANFDPNKPTLVLLHGFLEDSRMWAPLREKLIAGGNVLAIDLPGHGNSPSFGYEHRMEFMADVVEAVLSDLNLEKVSLLGHSMGGYVALAMAEHHPERLERLGLFFSTPEADSEERKEMRDKAADLVKSNKSAFVRGSIPLLFDPEAREEFSSAIQQQITYSLEMPKQGILAAIYGMKIREDRMRLLHLPPEQLAPNKIGVIAGIHDTVIPFERVQHWWDAPGVGFHYASHHGHMGHLTDSEGCGDAILRWWSGEINR